MIGKWLLQRFMRGSKNKAFAFFAVGVTGANFDKLLTVA